MYRKGEDLEKVSINLNRGDMAWFQARWPRIGASFVIRKLIREFKKKTESGDTKIDIDALELEVLE